MRGGLIGVVVERIVVAMASIQRSVHTEVQNADEEVMKDSPCYSEWFAIVSRLTVWSSSAQGKDG